MLMFRGWEGGSSTFTVFNPYVPKWNTLFLDRRLFAYYQTVVLATVVRFPVILLTCGCVNLQNHAL